MSIRRFFHETRSESAQPLFWADLACLAHTELIKQIALIIFHVHVHDATASWINFSTFSDTTLPNFRRRRSCSKVLAGYEMLFFTPSPDTISQRT